MRITHLLLHESCAELAPAPASSALVVSKPAGIARLPSWCSLDCKLATRALALSACQRSCSWRPFGASPLC
eukprot:4296252-Pleurochrysis_carterae.AAC.3